MGLFQYRLSMIHIRSFFMVLVLGILLAACSQVAEVPKVAPEETLESAATSPYISYEAYPHLSTPARRTIRW
jgi:hypothetical protein